MTIHWVDGFRIAVKNERGETVLEANRAGLLSLSRLFAELADGKPGDHIHLDEYNSLEDGSDELIIVKVGENDVPTDKS